MLDTDVLARVQALLKVRFSLSDEQVLADQALETLGIDSLAAIEFVFDLEDAFSVSLSEQRGDLKTVADIVALVKAAMDQQQAAA